MSLETDITALQQIEMFSNFNRDHLRLIAFGSHKLSFSKGYEIFQEGQKSDGGYLVLSGLISISIRGKDEKVHQGDYGPGSMLGEMALFGQNERGFTATVSEACELFKVTQSTMQRVLSEYPDLAVELHQQISKNFLDFTEKLPAIQEKLTRHDKDRA